MSLLKNMFRLSSIMLGLSCSKDENEQKTTYQLNAINAYQLKNHVWEPTQGDSFSYESISVTENFVFYNKDTKDYYTKLYYAKKLYWNNIIRNINQRQLI